MPVRAWRVGWRGRRSIDASIHGCGRKDLKDQNSKYIEFLSTRAKGIEFPKKRWQFWK